MIAALLGAAAAAVVASAWPFRRAGSDSGSDDEADDQRDWIYGDAPARKAAQDAPLPTQNEEPPNAPEATQAPELEGAGRRAELDARTIVERAERQAREIVAAAAEAPGNVSADGSEARRKTDEIVRDAEERARQILAEASASGARVDAEAARVGSLLMEERAKLAAFLRELLAEVEDSSAFDSQVLDLDEARERKQSTGAPD
jgi:hypothetical protein